jgi:histidinol-phosphate aminotransferase
MSAEAQRFSNPVAAAAPPHVRAIGRYQGGKPISELAREYGLDEAGIVKLASNENPLGIPESARAAMARAIAELARYPDGNGFELKAAISRRLNVPTESITLGNGSADLLDLAVRTFVPPGQSVVYSQHAFAVYPIATLSAGARAIVVPALTFAHDLDAMAAAIASDTRLIFIGNPNNPTGTFAPAPQIAAFLAKVPRDVSVVLDEAYRDYLEPSLRFDSTQWLREHPNLIVTRTFSKAYGLAGLRIGFALADPELTDLLNRVRQPFHVNSLAQAAAIAALDDDAFLRRSYEVNREGLAYLQSQLERLGLPFVPSHANFVLVEVGDAAAIYDRLLRAGVIVRPVTSYGLPRWLRVSVGLAHENRKFIAALEQALRAG